MNPYFVRFVVFCLATAATGAVGSQDPADAPSAGSQLQLHIRFGDGRSRFHPGEIIPIELKFSSTQHRSYRVIQNMPATAVTEYHWAPEPPATHDFELTAAGVGQRVFVGSGVPPLRDPGEKPIEFRDTLNRLFLFRTPGRYRVSITSHRLGLPVLSNTADLEILPHDPAWETAELERGVALIRSRAEGPEREEGCRTVESLETSGAHRAMASLFAKEGLCVGIFEVGLINADERQDVFDRLEAGFRDPARAVDRSLLRTLAYVSLYHQHPEWYLEAGARAGRAVPQTLIPPGTVSSRELDYAKSLVSLLRVKTAEARAGSLYMLLFLGRELGRVEIPVEIRDAVRAETPGVFDRLSSIEKTTALGSGWAGLGSPAMRPVLKRMAEAPGYTGVSRDLVLRRLLELSPVDARPHLLREMRSNAPTVKVATLSLLPDRELPELDEILFARIRSGIQPGRGGLETATGLLQRYATPAVADRLRSLLIPDGIGKMDCVSTANLIAYFLRAAPRDGAAMLRQERSGGRWPGCQILRRLAEVRMSPAVEQEALKALSSSEPGEVREALEVLRAYGSTLARAPLVDRFRQWHRAWAGRAGELARPENGARAAIDVDYLLATGAAHGWYSPRQELESLQALCVTARCRQTADRLLIQTRTTQRMLRIIPPVYDDVEDRLVLTPDGNATTIDRVKEKLRQFPKGTVLPLDTHSADYATVERIYRQLRPWAVEYGLELSRYRE